MAILPKDTYFLNHLIAKVAAADLLFRIERDSFVGSPSDLHSHRRLQEAKRELEMCYKVYFE
jgi:hypothetical protein